MGWGLLRYETRIAVGIGKKECFDFDEMKGNFIALDVFGISYETYIFYSVIHVCLSYLDQSGVGNKKCFFFTQGRERAKQPQVGTGRYSESVRPRSKGQGL